MPDYTAPLHHTASRIVDGERVDLSLHDQIVLLERDVAELAFPHDHFPTAKDLAGFMVRRAAIYTQLRQIKRALLEVVDYWERKRARIQRATAASDALSYPDTGTKRKELRLLVSATWGPVDPKNPSGGHGMKKDLGFLEEETGTQLAPLLIKGFAGEIPRTAKSYDDLVEIPAGDLRRVELLEEDMKAKHYDASRLTDLIQVESYERRALPQ